MPSVQLRPSQYVTTYGSGSMIPIASGYVVIPSLLNIIDDFRRFPDFQLNSFCIKDSNMENILKRKFPAKKAIKIFQMPSNADLTPDDNTYLFRSFIFPRWSVCNAHPGTPVLSKLQNISGHAEIRCPNCSSNANLSKRHKNRGSSVRFVRACNNGHLDDIDWKYEVHRGHFECLGDVFEWDESDSDNNFTVRCYGYYENGSFQRTNCDKSVSYFELRSKSDNGTLQCSGVMQEYPPRDNISTCGEPSKLILKNSSNIRVVDLMLAVSIPPVPGKLGILSENPLALDLFLHNNSPNFTHTQFLDHCKRINQKYNANLPIPAIETSTLDEIKHALTKISEDMTKKQSDKSEFDFENVINDEFNNLLNATVNGFPPQKHGTFTGLHIEPTDSIDFFHEDFNLHFRISPIRQLHLTRVQLGYSREVVTHELDDSDDANIPIIHRQGKLIYNYYDEDDTRWFVGHQLRGEGLFIQVCDPSDKNINFDPLTVLNTSNDSFDAWNTTYESWSKKSLEAKRKTNPRFVWWHALSHKIINQLAISSGFSSASIAERVYCHEDESGRHTSGLLLYTAQPGGDGTLGGLISLAPSFSEILSHVYHNIRICSNDPVCVDRRKTHNRFNGAACHACLFVSETSCDSYNKFLDRNLLLESLKR